MRALLLIVIVCLVSVEATQDLVQRLKHRQQSHIAMRKPPTPGLKDKVFEKALRFAQPSSHECYAGAISTIIHYYSARDKGCPRLISDIVNDPKFATKLQSTMETSKASRSKTSSWVNSFGDDTGHSDKVPYQNMQANDYKVALQNGQCPISPYVVALASGKSGHGAPTEEVLYQFDMASRIYMGDDGGTNIARNIPDWDAIVDEIKNFRPVALCVNSGGTGHAVVMVGYKFERKEDGSAVNKKACIIDPWIGRKEVECLDWPENPNDKTKNTFRVQNYDWKLLKVVFTRPPKA